MNREAKSYERVALHGLFWMAAANAIGVWLALCLLFPGLNAWAGEWTYGRWVPLHLNLHLYGWTCLPLLAWLFGMFRLMETPARRYVGSALWIWSLALALGAWSWLHGQTSGKIFLDWQGLPRTIFAAAMLFVWGLLAWAWLYHRLGPGHAPISPGPVLKSGFQGREGCILAWVIQPIGLLVLLSVPLVWYWAAGPGVYPAVNPHSGGPTGASLLGSTLVVVLLLLLFPRTLGERGYPNKGVVVLAWLLFFTEAGIYGLLNRSHASHRNLPQILGLGSLLPWLVLMPLYYRCFRWSGPARIWKNAFLFWIGLLVLTGWLSFLPGILDRLKFTNGLVAHSHLAMAGFVTCFNTFITVVLLRGSALSVRLSSRLPFWIWQSATLIYVLSMWVMGFMESEDPSFTILGHPWRYGIYALRLGCGLGMLGTSGYWLGQAWRVWRARDSVGEGIGPVSNPSPMPAKEVAA